MFIDEENMGYNYNDTIKYNYDSFNIDVQPFPSPNMLEINSILLEIWYEGNDEYRIEKEDLINNP